MKAGTESKLKFKKLQRRLNLKLWECVGILETLWHVTSGNTPRGDIGKMSNEDIAAALEWHGNADDLIAILVETKWLARHSVHRLVVHDWSDHAPNYVKGNLVKAKLRFANLDPGAEPGADPDEAPQGTIPKGPSPGDYPQGPVVPPGDEGPTKPSLAKPSQTNPKPVASATLVTGDPPVPEKPKKPEYPEPFERLWKAYPPRNGRKAGKDKTLGLWKRHVNADEREQAVIAAGNYAKCEQAVRGFAKDPERWIPQWRDWIGDAEEGPALDAGGGTGSVASSITPPPAGAIMRGDQLRWIPPEFQRSRDACIHAIERWADYQWRNHRRCWRSIEDAEVWMVDQALKSHHQFVHDVTKSMAKGWKSVIEDETFIGPPNWPHGAEDRVNIDMESGRRLRPFLGKNYPAHLGNGATTNVTTAATAG